MPQPRGVCLLGCMLGFYLVRAGLPSEGGVYAWGSVPSEGGQGCIPRGMGLPSQHCGKADPPGQNDRRK